MTTFIIVSLMILVLVITILYVHKVITSSHLEEELITVFKNLSNINAYINNISETPSQSPNTEIKETEITNLTSIESDIKYKTDSTIKEITDELDKDIEKANVNDMRNGAFKCYSCSNVDKDRDIEPCKTCISSGTKCNFVQDKFSMRCNNCVHFASNCSSCINKNKFELHVE